ncbi:hypothetical protein HDIA_4534 [Hartmannibacter diazotrophicus]|uniref:Glycosyltransferase RgtA/B/C/D-like domain-containing protein n=1 Tax=Hartmannibacter diazotrophicus TaxID=1482074 RepID=A0A2C9DE92_9HYPH|nr:hypothetical protein [Hartmannibacter diazotrophicus]SON58075.1 hypothetical protein HDIA_4534 [Hartmannibacter diazotrophicus]
MTLLTGGTPASGADIGAEGEARRSAIASTTVFALLASLAYLALLTNGSFDFSGIDTLGGAYEAYARSLLQGRFDVPFAAIGNEGMIVGGKYYLYYGIFPAILRLPFLYFDLPVPGPRVFVWLEACASALFLHLAILRMMAATAGDDARPAGIGTVVFAGLLAWVASPVVILAGNASVYHEPFGVALVCVSVFFWLLARPIACALRGSIPVLSTGELAALALAAGICLHGRPPMAVSLYMAVGFMCLWTLAEPVASGKLSGRMARLVARSLVPGMILGLALGLYLLVNWLRFGDPLETGPVASFGFRLHVYGDDPWMKGVVDDGRFQLLRIIPNFLMHLFNAEGLQETIIRGWSLNAVRNEPPLIGAFFLWLPYWSYGLLGAIFIARLSRRTPLPGLWFAGLALACSISFALILSYATVAFRYKLAFCPLLFLFLLGGIGAECSWRTALPAVTQSKLVWLLGRNSLLFRSMLAISVVVTIYAAFYYKQNDFLNGRPDSALFQTGLRPGMQPPSSAE